MKSHKENLETIDDDDEEEDKKDDNKDDDGNDNDDHDDHALISTQRRHINNTFVTNRYFQVKNEGNVYTLNNLVPELTVAKTNELIKEAVPRIVNDVVKQDIKSSTAIVLQLISQEFIVHASKIIKELFKNHMKK
ncbi:hypothetical protein Tco_0787746 [Tanacetum coccineum]